MSFLRLTSLLIIDVLRAIDRSSHKLTMIHTYSLFVSNASRGVIYFVPILRDLRHKQPTDNRKTEVSI